jgi:ubiquinone/menaquinone biosynthesis C-methylase UbiE
MPAGGRCCGLVPKKVLVEMGVRPGMVAVDLCCGDGLFTAPLACIADRVYAIDIDPVMLNCARVRLQRRGQPTAISSWRTP